MAKAISMLKDPKIVYLVRRWIRNESPEDIICITDSLESALIKVDRIRSKWIDSDWFWGTEFGYPDRKFHEFRTITREATDWYTYQITRMEIESC